MEEKISLGGNSFRTTYEDFLNFRMIQITKIMQD